MIAYNISSIYDIAEGNVPKGKGASARSVYAVLDEGAIYPTPFYL